MSSPVVSAMLPPQEVVVLSARTNFAPTRQWYVERKYTRDIDSNTVDLNSTILASGRIARHVHERELLHEVQRQVSPNLHFLCQAFFEISDPATGRFSSEGFLERVTSDEMGVERTRTRHTQRVFEELDPTLTGSASFSELMLWMQATVNGPGREGTARIMFDAFDPRKTGYVLKPLILSLKGYDSTSSSDSNNNNNLTNFDNNTNNEQNKNVTFQLGGGIDVVCTHLMVTALVNVFGQVHRDEDAQLLAALKKGKKKSKKKNPTIPEPLKRKFHINFEEFLKFYDTDGQLLLAMVPIVLLSMSQHTAGVKPKVAPV
eukprot:PhM_4_TR13655/c0_g1_i2/m.15912